MINDLVYSSPTSIPCNSGDSLAVMRLRFCAGEEEEGITTFSAIGQKLDSGLAAALDEGSKLLRGGTSATSISNRIENLNRQSAKAVQDATLERQ